jgi:hypothetical protein
MKPVIQRMSALLPAHDKPRAEDNIIDKKRLRKTMATIYKMDHKYRDMASRGELDPEFVKKIYDQTK